MPSSKHSCTSDEISSGSRPSSPLWPACELQGGNLQQGKAAKSCRGGMQGAIVASGDFIAAEPWKELFH